MKKVLQINSCVALYSTGQLVENIGKVALSNGWLSYIAYGRAAKTSKSQIIRIGKNFDVYFHAIKSKIFDAHGLGSKRATKALIAKIKKIKPDIIQLHNIHGYYLNYEIFFNFLNEANIPIVWSLHDCWAFTGHCSHFALIECNKWETECNNCPLTSSYPSSIIDKSTNNYILKKKLFTSNKNITIVSASEWLGGMIRKSYLSKYPLRIIPNGIDLEIFYPRKNTIDVIKTYGLEKKFVIMGVASSWGAAKGLYDYYKLNDLLTDEYVIVLVGLTKKHCQNLPKGIIGISLTHSIDELAQLYSAADVITSLSYLEAFGLTPIEGFACGTPAIVYNATSTPELINPKIGLIVEPGNVTQVFEAIKTIRGNGKNFYSKNCRKQAEIFYNKNDRFGDYLNLYEEILINLKTK
jgi:glycosyltransferase involved in cell wall biosynthesis